MGSTTEQVTWQRVWQSGRHTIRLGEFPDGRWLVWRSTGQLREYWDERSACEQVQKAMGRRAWIEATVEAAA